MIPVCDAVPTPTRPLVTLALLAVILTVFLTLPSAATSFIGTTSVAPGWLPEAMNAAIATVRPVDWLALAATALALWLYGPTVEDRLGRSRFALLYFGSGLLATAGVAAAGLSTWVNMGGTAAAVAAVIGARLTLYPRGRTLMLIPVSDGLDVIDVPSGLVAGFWFLAQLASTGAHLRLYPGWSASTAVVHILAGAILGSIGGRLLARQERMRVEWWNP